MNEMMSEPHGLASRMLTAQHLAVVLAVAEEGTFTDAAAKLDITQSAVSHSIQQIERVVGTELFARGRQGAKPTPALEGVLGRMRRLHHELHAVVHDLAADNEPLRGSVRIAGFRSAVGVLLPPAISKFAGRHRNVQISLSAMRERGAGVVQSLEDGTADLALTTVKPPSRFRSLYLGSDRYVLVQPAQQSSGHDTFEKLILWRERCSEIVPEILRSQNWTVRDVMEVDTDTAVLAMVAHGSGFTIVPELAAEPLPQNVRKVPLTTDFRRHVWLCGSGTAFDSRIGRVLIRYIRTAASSWLS